MTMVSIVAHGPLLINFMIAVAECRAQTRFFLLHQLYMYQDKKRKLFEFIAGLHVYMGKFHLHFGCPELNVEVNRQE